MKIAVTGGSGRVGQTLIRALKEAGHHVTNLDRKRPDEWISPFIEVDLRDLGQVYDALASAKPDAVVHLAADPRAHGRVRHPLFVENVSICHAVMQASVDLGVRRIVYASSEQANGWTSAKSHPKRLPLDEENATTPQSAYALSKWMGELIADSFVAGHPDLTVASLRLNFVALPEGYERMRGWRPEEHMSSNLWGYVDVRDVAEACRLALAAPIEGHRIFNINATDTLCHTPTREVVTRWLGEDVEIAEDLPEFGALVDCSRAERELGWQPSHSWRSLEG